MQVILKKIGKKPFSLRQHCVCVYCKGAFLLQSNITLLSEKLDRFHTDSFFQTLDSSRYLDASGKLSVCDGFLMNACMLCKT